MVRFKVVKGSHILLVVSVILLVAVLAFIAIQSKSTALFGSIPAKHIETSATNEKAKALSAFAFSPVSGLKIQIIREDDEIPEARSPSILIYHTHTHEAYLQNQENPYTAVEAWRTSDENHNVVRLGSALAENLASLGFDVIHDKTDHEQADIDAAYLRSLETLESYDKEFDLVIDLHRDAYFDNALPFLKHNGKRYAQLMMLVGRGDKYDDAEKPPYDANLQFAQKITNTLNEQISGICRNVTVKTGRYNQHIGKHSILVEVGHNRNSLEEALNSIPYLAKAIQFVLRNE